MKLSTLLKLTSMLALVLGISLSAAAQKGRFTIFSEDGDPFFLVVDGKRINTKADVRVEPTDLPGSRVKVKIIFADSKKPSIDDAIHIKDFDNKYVYAKYVIRKKKDKYVIRISDYEEELNVNNEWVQTHKDEPATTTTTTTKKPTQPAKPSTEDDMTGDVNITMPGVTIKANERGMDMKVEDPELEHSVVTTTTTTRTTRNGKVTTTKTTGRPTAPDIGPTVAPTPAPAPATSAIKPISAAGYTSLINNIKRQGFEDNKVKIAQLSFRNNGFNTNQIKEILKLMNFEQSRLDLAKAAYNNCTDKESFMDVSEAFNFSSSTEELTTFLESKQ